MIAATPASYKTFLALYWVARMGLRTLFFSADTDQFEMAKRATAMVSGERQDDVARRITDYADLLAQLNIRWVFESDPTYTDLALETAAYAEAFGDFPEVIVIDNLMNVVGENENEWSSMRDTTKAIKRLVRITEAALFVLHHMGEDKADQSMPQPRSKLQGKVSQLPEIILSLSANGDELRVAPVKNRFGPGDASGQTFVSLFLDPERVQIFNNRYDKQAGIPA